MSTLTEAIVQMQDEAAAREAGACTEITESERVMRALEEAESAMRLPAYFKWAVVALVCVLFAWGWVAPWGFAR